MNIPGRRVISISLLMGCFISILTAGASASVVILENHSRVSALTSVTDEIDSVTDSDSQSTTFPSNINIPDAFGDVVSAHTHLEHTSPSLIADAYANASLSATVDQFGQGVSITGTGSAEADTTLVPMSFFSSEASTESTLILVLQLDNIYDYTVTSGLIQTIGPESGATYVSTSLRDTSDGSEVFFEEIAFGESGTFSLSGTLPAGTYQYNLTSGAFVSPIPDFGSVSFDSVSFSLTTVPVPAAIWLFGSGLLGLVGMARRKKST